MATEQQMYDRANISAAEKAKRDKDRVKKTRNSPDINKMFGLRIGRTEFYFVSEEWREKFWNGGEHTKGYRDKLIKTFGQEYVDNLNVEYLKKESNVV